MRAVITVVGRDNTGIVRDVAGQIAEHGLNIVEISQQLMGGFFTMIILVEAQGAFPDIADAFTTWGKERALTIHVQHEDIFKVMNQI